MRKRPPMRSSSLIVASVLLLAAAAAMAQSDPPQMDTRAFAEPPASMEDYQIGPNDLLEIKVFELQELDRTVRVSTDGTISLPPSSWSGSTDR